jgi:hypothetical protein
MKAAVVGTVVFAIAQAVPGALFSLALFFQSPRRPDATGDFLVIVILAGTAVALSSVGFFIPVVFSDSWRRLTGLRRVIIAAGLGVAAPIAALFVGAVMSAALLPLFRSGYWLAAAPFHGLPGLVLGAVAVLSARALTRRGA